jgi:uncharacterized protein YydD (DUF2326 family)|eukprot:6057316-Prymnesium_polylepis.1
MHVCECGYTSGKRNVLRHQATCAARPFVLRVEHLISEITLLQEENAASVAQISAVNARCVDLENDNASLRTQLAQISAVNTFFERKVAELTANAHERDARIAEILKDRAKLLHALRTKK